MFKNNKVYRIDKHGNKKRVFFFRKYKNLRIKFLGRNNTVELKEPIAKFKSSKLILSDNCIVKIGSSKHKIVGLRIIAKSAKSSVIIGNNLSSEKRFTIVMSKEPDTTLSIGDDVMIANNVQIRTSDSHTIYDISTNEILNHCQNIEIGNHVWISQNCMICKGVKIADNCVIGANSLVTRSCSDSNSIYAGTPAKKIRTNINWDRLAPYKFDNNSDNKSSNYCRSRESNKPNGL